MTLEFRQEDLRSACNEMRAAWGPMYDWNEVKAEIYDGMCLLLRRLEPGATYSVDRGRLPPPFHVGFGWVDVAVRNRELADVAAT